MRSLFSNSTAMILLGSVIALFIANLGSLFDDPIAKELAHLSHFFHEHKVTLLGHSETISHWVILVFLSPFFLNIGIEVSRELHMGKLNSIRKAMSPAVGAVGGVIMPAFIFAAVITYLKIESEAIFGAAIPTATDIMFTVAVINIFKNVMPDAMRSYLLALAVIDDIIAVIITVVVFNTGIDWYMLGSVAVVMVILAFIRIAMNVQNLLPYLVLGVVMWLFMLHSGVHATLAAVILGFFIPFDKVDNYDSDDYTPDDPAHHLEHFLSEWITPPCLAIFAFFSTGVVISLDAMTSPIAIAVAAGLFLGKPIGILLFTYLGSLLRISDKPEVSFIVLLGGGFAAGIGYTMSFFMASVSYEGHAQWLSQALMGVIIGSVLSAFITILIWKIAFNKAKKINF